MYTKPKSHSKQHNTPGNRQSSTVQEMQTPERFCQQFSLLQQYCHGSCHHTELWHSRCKTVLIAVYYWNTILKHNVMHVWHLKTQKHNFLQFILWYTNRWGTGIRELMRGMATLLQGNQELLVARDKVGRPAGELGVSKSMECDIFPFSTLTRLVGRQEGHLACKKSGRWFVGGDDLTGALHDL